MKINVTDLISYEELKGDVQKVFEKVDENEKVVILKNNKPAYILMKYNLQTEPKDTNKRCFSKYKLQEAMQIVLSDAENNEMHAALIADEIYNRELYFKKDGNKAMYNQIRARCGHYQDLFEALPGNIIKLKGKKSNHI